jgi:hypothetical protein
LREKKKRRKTLLLVSPIQENFQRHERKTPVPSLGRSLYGNPTTRAEARKAAPAAPPPRYPNHPMYIYDRTFVIFGFNRQKPNQEH